MMVDDTALPDPEMPRSAVGIVLGLWLSGVFAASLGGWFEQGRDHTLAMGLLGAAAVWPLLYFAASPGRFIPRALPSGAMAALVLFISTAAASCFVSPVMMRSVGYLVLTVAGLWVALQFNSQLDRRQFERGLALFAVLTAGLLAAFAWYDYVPGKRLGTGKDILNPNTIALVAVSVLLAAMAIRTWVVRLAVMMPVAGILVLTSSRAAAVAAVAGGAMMAWSRLRARGRSAMLPALAVLLVLAMALVFYGDTIVRALDRLYALSTADRGIASGASGRLAAWKGTWTLFVHSPAIGVGFRAHEQVLKADTSAHNGYLATLAEIGVIGFAAVVYLVGRALRSLWRAAHDPELTTHASVLFGLCAGYLLLALFERYLINIGNPTSLLFLLCLMRPAPTERPYDDAADWIAAEDESIDEEPTVVSRA